MTLFLIASASLNALLALYIGQPHVRRDFARWLTPAKRRDLRVINLPMSGRIEILALKDIDVYSNNVEGLRKPPRRTEP